MRRRVAAGAAAIVLAGLPAAAHAPPAAAAAPAPSCAMTGARLSVGRGPPAMAVQTWVVRVQSRSRGLCTLPAYISLRIRSSVGPAAPPAVFFVSAPFGRRLPAMPASSLVVLRPEQTASTLLVNLEPPLSAGAKCHPIGVAASVLDAGGRSLSGGFEFCGGDLDVAPFFLGFDGQSVGGEIVGMAPSCPWPTHGTGVGPVVQVDAWRGRTVANTALVIAEPTATTGYRMDVPVGLYRVTTPGERSRLLRVRPGFAAGLGAYGTCSMSLMTTSTTSVPGRTRLTTTTTTTASAAVPTTTSPRPGP